MEFIESFKEGQRVIGHYLCEDKQMMTARTGKNYLKLVLEDKTGSITAMVWELGPQIGPFDKGEIIKIDGTTSIYQGAMQLSVTRLRRSEAHEYAVDDYYRTSRESSQVLYERLLGYMQQIRDMGLRHLVESFYVDDQALIERLLRHPAAKSVHHNYIGGLLEHTVSVTGLALYMAEQYQPANPDLIIAGALLHDIGKLREIKPLPLNEYSDEGQLLGHIAIGYMMVHERGVQIPDLSPQLLMQLEHMILAHHGELEFGSPKVPSTIDAMILYLADLSDSKLKQVEDAIDTDHGEGHWTAYHRILGRTFYKPDGESHEAAE